LCCPPYFRPHLSIRGISCPLAPSTRSAYSRDARYPSLTSGKALRFAHLGFGRVVRNMRSWSSSRLGSGLFYVCPARNRPPARIIRPEHRKGPPGRRWGLPPDSTVVGVVHPGWSFSPRFRPGLFSATRPPPSVYRALTTGNSAHEVV